MSGNFYAVGFSPEEKTSARYLNGQGDHDRIQSHSDRETRTAAEEWDGGDYNDPE